MLDKLAAYRNPVRLKDGEHVLLRPLLKEDKEALIRLFTSIPPEELPLMSDPLDIPREVAEWVDNLDYAHVFPLVAVINGRIVGDATLHFRSGRYRHVAEVRIVLATDYRHRGLGHCMLRSLIDIAHGMGMKLLVAEVVAKQKDLLRALRAVGFEHQAILPDFIMAPNGVTHDVSLLTLSLEAAKGTEF
jgi:L-amino acid N-acyltransferase YncA